MCNWWIYITYQFGIDLFIGSESMDEMYDFENRPQIIDYYKNDKDYNTCSDGDVVYSFLILIIIIVFLVIVYCSLFG